MSWFDIFAIVYVIFLIAFVSNSCKDNSEVRPDKKDNDK